MLRKILPLVLALSACPEPVIGGGTGGGGDANGGGSGGAGGGSGGGDETFAASAKGNVRFKRSVRLTLDYANALSLPADQLCKELGQYPCALVHIVSLGGTDPYGVGLYEPLPFTGMASPVVVERLALSACTLRTSTDLAAGSSAVIWKGVVPDGAGKVDVESAAAHDALVELYHRVMLREPTAAELDHLKQLYRDIDASAKPQPGQSWMTLSCFAVLTSVEALFY